MVALRNNFDTGPDGTTITTANSGTISGNNSFDVAQGSGTGVLLKYADTSTLNRATAAYAMKIATPGSGITTSPAAGWGNASLGANGTLWGRVYVYFSSVATNTNNQLNLLSIYNVSSVGFGVSAYLDTTVLPIIFNVLNNNTGLQTGGSITPVANTWNRLEFRVTMGTGTAGSSDFYIYAGDDSDSNTPTEHIGQTSQNYGSTTANVFLVGQGVAGQTNTPSTYFSNFEVNNTGYPGPAPFRAGLGAPSGGLANPIAIHSDIS